jgi:cell division protease FtsH
MTREFAQNTICILMGGRVAEEIIFGQKTTGAGNDIERATDRCRARSSTPPRAATTSARR